MITLTRQGREVFHNGIKLTRVDQASKGEGKEVIKIEGLEGSNGAKWISLSKLQEGEHDYEVHGKEVTSSGSYTLTTEEKAEVDKLQARINEIKSAARARFVPKPKLLTPEQMVNLTPEARKEAIDAAALYLKSLRDSVK